MQTLIRSTFYSKFLTATAILAMVLAALPVMSVQAADITVDTQLDELITNSECSLREAILNANSDSLVYPDCPAGTGHDTIILESGTTYTLSLVDSTYVGGDLDISDTDGLTIQASGAANAIIDANEIDRVIDTTAGSGPLTLVGITITNGNAASGGRGGGLNYSSNSALTLINSTVSSNVATNQAACGGGIYNSSTATINIINSTFEGNTCTVVGGDGGALWKGTGGALNIYGSTFNNNSTADDDAGAIRIVAGTASITNSTFANNTAGDLGGAIEVDGVEATLAIVFSTFSGNTALDGGNNGGGALYVSSGHATITSSILANSPAGQDCAVSDGTVDLIDTLIENNVNCNEVSVITASPDLDPLADNGGPTQTMAITATSPAYNAADSCSSIVSDQRGVARPQEGFCDLGAFELGATDAAPVVLNVVRADDNPTEVSSTVDFIVIFSEPVTGVDVGDFAATMTGGVSGATVTSVSGSGAVYTVTMDTGTGEGTVGLSVLDNGTILDLDSASDSLASGFTGGEFYSVQANVAPVVLNVLIADSSPTSATSVDFTVTFSESVDGVDENDFDLTTTGSISGATVTGVVDTGDQITYTVSVNTGSGDGTIRLDVLANGSIIDSTGNPLAGGFASGEEYTVIKSAEIEVYIAGALQDTYTVPSGGRETPFYDGMFDGPVRVVSTNGIPIIASERTLYGKSFNETNGIPGNQLTTEYWFPWYDYQIMQTWVSVGNPSETETAHVSVYIAGEFKSSMSIPPQGRWTPHFPGVFDGPVLVKSTEVLETAGNPSTVAGIPIIVSERTLYGKNFNETNGIPGNQLTTEYWFPWYDYQIMQTWISIAVP